MIRGEWSYFSLSPTRFCNQETIASILKAQMKAREMLLFTEIISGNLGNPDSMTKDFQNEQSLQNKFVQEICKNDFQYDEQNVDLLKEKVGVENTKEGVAEDNIKQYGESDRIKREVATFKLYSKENSIKNIVMSDPDFCVEYCETVTNEAEVMCEGLGVFGANFVCTALLLTGRNCFNLVKFMLTDYKVHIKSCHYNFHTKLSRYFANFCYRFFVISKRIRSEKH